MRQRTPGAAEYREGLSPEQFADRFGLSVPDLEAVKSWFEAQGLTTTGTSRSRSWISLSGTAAQMEGAFQTELHRYAVNGQVHIANSMAPSLPVELISVVRAVRGLNDFHARPFKRRGQLISAAAAVQQGHRRQGPEAGDRGSDANQPIGRSALP